MQTRCYAICFFFLGVGKNDPFFIIKTDSIFFFTPLDDSEQDENFRKMVVMRICSTSLMPFVFRNPLLSLPSIGNDRSKNMIHFLALPQKMIQQLETCKQWIWIECNDSSNLEMSVDATRSVDHRTMKNHNIIQIIILKGKK